MIQVGDTVQWESASGLTKIGRVLEIYKNKQGETMLRVVATIATRIALSKVKLVQVAP